MNGLEERVRHSMHDRAHGAVDVERLLSGAAAGGKRNASRRRLAQMTGTVVVVLVVVVGVAGAVLRLGGPPPGSDGPASPAPPVEQRPGRPPAVAGTPATADPAVVGADVRRFHIDADLPSYDNIATTWTSSRHGTEEFSFTEISMEAPKPIPNGRFTIARDPSLLPSQLQDLPGAKTRDVDVNGVPGVAVDAPKDWYPETSVRWQPLRGVWAQATAAGTQQPDVDAVAYARMMRLDRVYRCAVPVRATWAPQGTSMTECTYSWNGLFRRQGGTPRYDVNGATTTMRRHDPSAGPYGQIVRFPGSDNRRLLLGLPTEECTLVVEAEPVRVGEMRIDEPTARRILEGMRCVKSDDPMQWPDDAFA